MATLTYVYSEQTAVLGPLATYAEPHTYDLCVVHAKGLTAPRGWDVIRLLTEYAEPSATPDDVRGLVPQQLNEAVAFAIGSAFAQVVAQPDGARSVVVGHDMRASSPSLSRSFAAGAASRGVDVTLIGLCSTD